jgi:fused signal recognition particle receptor
VLKFLSRKKRLEQELKKNPAQPEKWLALAELDESAMAGALANALLYSEGRLLPKVLKKVRDLALHREFEAFIPAIEKKLGKPYSAIFQGIAEEYRGNLTKARNLYDVSGASAEPHLKALSNLFIASLCIKQGLDGMALEFLKKAEKDIPEEFRLELSGKKKALEKGSKPGVLKSLKASLKKTRDTLGISRLSTASLGQELLDELEERLILADVGVSTAVRLVGELRKDIDRKNITTFASLVEALKNRLADALKKCSAPLNIEGKPCVVLVLGVNGSGKTTTVGKLAKMLKDSGLSVVVAAGDTFRAGAIEQLEVWAHRAGARVVKAREGTDPAAVVYDAVHSTLARGEDVLLVDTAGRLHNREALMREVQKIKRVIARELPGQPSEVLLVLDANTGQNAISQARVFKEITDVTGIALTKLDGSAKGGVVVAICSELKVPVKLLGVGEGIDDIKPFEPEEFVDALFSPK